MASFSKISDQIVLLSQGKIQQRHYNRIIPLVMVGIGAVMLLLSLFYASVDRFDAMLLMSFAIIIILTAFAFSFKNRNVFIVKSSGKRIRAHRFDLFSEDSLKIVDLMSHNKVNEVLAYRVDQNSSLKLELWYDKSYEQVYAQVLHYQDASMHPLTDVHVIKYIDLSLPFKSKR